MGQLKTSEFVSRLALGEISNLSMASPGDGTIDTPANKTKILMQINNGLKELFTKYLLSQKEVVVNSVETITHYYLRYEFAKTNVASVHAIEDRYIDDTGLVDWDGRIVKILNVYDAFGRELFINKEQEPLSVFTPQYDCLQITANHQTEDFYVIFQALHPIVDLSDDYTTTDDLIEDLPPALEKPLEYLVASKIYGNMNGEANLTKSAMLHQMYEAEIATMVFADTASTSENTSNSKLERAGFV